MYLVFDIGATKMRVSVSQDGKNLIEPKIFNTPKSYQQGLNLIKEASTSFSINEPIKAIAGGVAGVLDKDKSMIVKSPNISSDWTGKPLKEDLNQIFHASVFLENDASLDGLGEACFGSGKNKNIVAYLTVGTGVGGTRIVDGKIDQNAFGFEIGHQIIDINGPLCSCGGKGHLESYISGLALQKKYNQDPALIKDQQVWEEVSKILAVGLNNIIVHWSPDIIVVGGSVASSIPLQTTIEHLNEILTIFPEKPEVAKASLGDFGGLYGALTKVGSF